MPSLFLRFLPLDCPLSDRLLLVTALLSSEWTRCWLDFRRREARVWRVFINIGRALAGRDRFADQHEPLRSRAKSRPVAVLPHHGRLRQWSQWRRRSLIRKQAPECRCPTFHAASPVSCAGHRKQSQRQCTAVESRANRLWRAGTQRLTSRR